MPARTLVKLGHSVFSDAAEIEPSLRGHGFHLFRNSATAASDGNRIPRPLPQMVDRFNRMFLRVLRQMRDLRRYSVPVTINNPKQVNIAADGGQQVNVQENPKVKGRKRKKASNKPQPILKAAK